MRFLSILILTGFCLAGQELVAKAKSWEVISEERTEVVAENPLELELKGTRLFYLYQSKKYEITITNRGETNIGNVTLMAFLPEHLDYIAAEPRARYRPKKKDKSALVRWENIEIAAQSQVKIILELQGKKRRERVLKVELPGVLSNKTMEWKTKIIGVPAIHVSTYDTKDPVIVGETFTYVVVIRQEGTAPTTNIILKNDFSPFVKFCDAKEKKINNPVEYKYDKKKKRLIFEPFPILLPGDEITYYIHCKTVRAGKSINTARVCGGDWFDQGLLDEEITYILEKKPKTCSLLKIGVLNLEIGNEK